MGTGDLTPEVIAEKRMQLRGLFFKIQNYDDFDTDQSTKAILHKAMKALLSELPEAERKAAEKEAVDALCARKEL